MLWQSYQASTCLYSSNQKDKNKLIPVKELKEDPDLLEDEDLNSKFYTDIDIGNYQGKAQYCTANKCQ